MNLIKPEVDKIKASLTIKQEILFVSYINYLINHHEQKATKTQDKRLDTLDKIKLWICFFITFLRTIYAAIKNIYSYRNI